MSFIRNLDFESAIVREIGGFAGWESTLKTNFILADIYDILQTIAAMLGGRKHKIKPYARPFDKEKKKQSIGKGAMKTVADLKQWLEDKRNGRRKL